MSNVSGNQNNDQSNFDCEVHDQDDSLIEKNSRNTLGDNYQLGQRITLDEIKQAQAQIGKKQSSTQVDNTSGN